ncbi:hypothetical protein Hanom_Chr02g00107411 [Helianthus anomalus]
MSSWCSWCSSRTSCFLLHSTMNSLDLTDFHINKLRSIIDLDIFMVEKDWKKVSNFLSTLLHSNTLKPVETKLEPTHHSFPPSHGSRFGF